MANLSLDEVTIGIVTVLQEEFAAACELLGCDTPIHINGRIYLVGKLKHSTQLEFHTIAVCCAPDMGTSTAAATATNLLNDCKNIRLVGMCGIAGGVPNVHKASDHVRLGDVVVATSIVQYDSVKESQTEIQKRPRTHSPSYPIINAINYLAILAPPPWKSYIEEGIETLVTKEQNNKWKRPSADEDQLREFDGRCMDFIIRFFHFLGLKKYFQYSPILHPYDGQRADNVPRIFSGVFASANNLQKNPKHRDLLQKQYGAKAVEMESIGIGDAAFAARAEFFVVKGVCDYCNGDKNDLWHHYAAVTAAAYTKALLEIVPVQTILAPVSQNPIIVVEKTESIATKIPTSLIQSSEEIEALAEAISSKIVVSGQINETLDEIINIQVAEHMRKIKLLVDSLELENACKEANQLEAITRTAATKLPPELLKEAYEWLARIATIEGNLNGSLAEGLKKADEFIARAKNVRSR